MTKITIADTTDDQINAAIARLDGWIFHKKTSALNAEWCHIGIGQVTHKKIIGEAPPDYLHSWTLCGPLLSSIAFELKHWPALHTKCAITIWKDNKTEWLNKLEFIAKDERRVRCLAYLAQHFPDGMIEVDDG